MAEIGEEVYQRNARPLATVQADPDGIGHRARLVEQVVGRLRGPYGAGGGLAAHILAHLGWDGAAAGGSASPPGRSSVMVMRMYEPRRGEPGRRRRRTLAEALDEGLLGDLPLTGWPQFPHSVTPESEPPRWRAVADEGQLGYPPPATLPQIVLPPLRQLLSVDRYPGEPRPTFAPPMPLVLGPRMAPAVAPDEAHPAPLDGPVPTPGPAPSAPVVPPLVLPVRAAVAPAAGQMTPVTAPALPVARPPSTSVAPLAPTAPPVPLAPTPPSAAPSLLARMRQGVAQRLRLPGGPALMAPPLVVQPSIGDPVPLRGVDPTASPDILGSPGTAAEAMSRIPSASAPSDAPFAPLVGPGETTNTAPTLDGTAPMVPFATDAGAAGAALGTSFTEARGARGGPLYQALARLFRRGEMSAEQTAPRALPLRRALSRRATSLAEGTDSSPEIGTDSPRSTVAPPLAARPEAVRPSPALPPTAQASSANTPGVASTLPTPGPAVPLAVQRAASAPVVADVGTRTGQQAGLPASPASSIPSRLAPTAGLPSLGSPPVAGASIPHADERSTSQAPALPVTTVPAAAQAEGVRDSPAFEGQMPPALPSSTGAAGSGDAATTGVAAVAPLASTEATAGDTAVSLPVPTYTAADATALPARVRSAGVPLFTALTRLLRGMPADDSPLARPAPLFPLRRATRPPSAEAGEEAVGEERTVAPAAVQSTTTVLPGVPPVAPSSAPLAAISPAGAPLPPTSGAERPALQAAPAPTVTPPSPPALAAPTRAASPILPGQPAATIATPSAETSYRSAATTPGPDALPGSLAQASPDGAPLSGTPMPGTNATPGSLIQPVATLASPARPNGAEATVLAAYVPAPLPDVNAAPTGRFARLPLYQTVARLLAARSDDPAQPEAGRAARSMPLRQRLRLSPGLPESDQTARSTSPGLVASPPTPPTPGATPTAPGVAAPSQVLTSQLAPGSTETLATPRPAAPLAQPNVPAPPLAGLPPLAPASLPTSATSPTPTQVALENTDATPSAPPSLANSITTAPTASRFVADPRSVTDIAGVRGAPAAPGLPATPPPAGAMPSRFAGLPLYQALGRLFTRRPAEQAIDGTPGEARPPLPLRQRLRPGAATPENDLGAPEADDTGYVVAREGLANNSPAPPSLSVPSVPASPATLTTPLSTTSLAAGAAPSLPAASGQAAATGESLVPALRGPDAPIGSSAVHPDENRAPTQAPAETASRLTPAAAAPPVPPVPLPQWGNAPATDTPQRTAQGITSAPEALPAASPPSRFAGLPLYQTLARFFGSQQEAPTAAEADSTSRPPLPLRQRLRPRVGTTEGEQAATTTHPSSPTSPGLPTSTGSIPARPALTVDPSAPIQPRLPGTEPVAPTAQGGAAHSAPGSPAQVLGSAAPVPPTPGDALPSIGTPTPAPGARVTGATLPPVADAPALMAYGPSSPGPTSTPHATLPLDGGAPAPPLSRFAGRPLYEAIARLFTPRTGQAEDAAMPGVAAPRALPLRQRTRPPGEEQATDADETIAEATPIAGTASLPDATAPGLAPRSTTSASQGPAGDPAQRALQQPGMTAAPSTTLPDAAPPIGINNADAAASLLAQPASSAAAASPPAAPASRFAGRPLYEAIARLFTPRAGQAGEADPADLATPRALPLRQRIRPPGEEPATDAEEMNPSLLAPSAPLTLTATALPPGTPASQGPADDPVLLPTQQPSEAPAATTLPGTASPLVTTQSADAAPSMRALPTSSAEWTAWATQVENGTLGPPSRRFANGPLYQALAGMFARAEAPAIPDTVHRPLVFRTRPRPTRDADGESSIQPDGQATTPPAPTSSQPTTPVRLPAVLAPAGEARPTIPATPGTSPLAGQPPIAPSGTPAPAPIAASAAPGNTAAASPPQLSTGGSAMFPAFSEENGWEGTSAFAARLIAAHRGGLADGGALGVDALAATGPFAFATLGGGRPLPLRLRTRLGLAAEANTPDSPTLAAYNNTPRLGGQTDGDRVGLATAQGGRPSAGLPGTTRPAAGTPSTSRPVSSAGIALQRQIAGAAPPRPANLALWRRLALARQRGPGAATMLDDWADDGEGAMTLPPGLTRQPLWAEAEAGPLRLPPAFPLASGAAGAASPFLTDDNGGDNPAAGLSAGEWTNAPSVEVGHDGRGLRVVAPSSAAPPALAVQRAGRPPSMNAAAPARNTSASGDAAEWAGVVDQALHDAPSPAALNLSLAAEERTQPTAELTEMPQQEQEQPNLDELAEQVYSRLRRRLLVERERTWS